MADMFSSVEAGNAALALSGKNMGRYIGFIEEMEKASGATQTAFDKMNTGVSFIMDRIKTKISVAMIEIGEKLSPTFEKFATWLDTNMPAIVDTVVGGFKLMSDAIIGLGDAVVSVKGFFEGL
jgi:TP901 family phage tail tape measure protein